MKKLGKIVFGILGIICSLWILGQCYLFISGQEYSKPVFLLSALGFSLQWLVESVVRIITGKSKLTFKFGKNKETTIELP